MTPAARVAAAIEVLDVWSQGTPAEQALTRWARQSRFAGSKDRAAVRDHVFDVLRCKQTAVFLGGGETGRAMMIGLLRHQHADLDSFFSGQGHAPAPLTDEERAFAPPKQDRPLWNLPPWLTASFEISLGDAALQTAQELQNRAPVTLRVNSAKSDIASATSLLAAAGIDVTENPLCRGALTVTEGARRLRNAQPYLDGIVEVQDAASQAVVALLPQARNCLDYCAGGGGKALAIASQSDRTVFAHDHNPVRMKDIAPRAARAGVRIQELTSAAVTRHAPFDLVLCDVPCSGSGAWRRSPDAKWSFTPDRLQELQTIQLDVLGRAAPLVAAGGWLVYATCSVLRCENEEIVTRFVAENDGWRCAYQKRFDVTPQGDGFFTAHLTHD